MLSWTLSNAGAGPATNGYLITNPSAVFSRWVLWQPPQLAPTASYFVNSPNTVRNGNWAVINLRAGYDWSKFGLFLEAVNLTDRYYFGSVIVDDGAGRLYEPSTPRSVYAGIRVRF